jgi:hypothetical protein
MIRQPDECICFGGRCLRKFCPNQSKKAKDEHVRPEGPRQRRKKVLKLSDSLREMGLLKKEENVDG